MINRRLYRKLEGSIGEEQFGFRKGKETRDAIGLMRVIGERYIEKQRDVYVVFTDLEKAFDRVEWDKLLRVLKEKGVDWKERRLIKELYFTQKVKIKIVNELSDESRLSRGVR